MSLTLVLLYGIDLKRMVLGIGLVSPPSLQAERLSALSRNPVHFKGEFAKSNHAVRARGRPQMSKLFTSLLGSQSDQASFKINMHNKHSTGLEQSRGGEGELSKLLTSLYANQSNHSILGTLQIT